MVIRKASIEDNHTLVEPLLKFIMAMHLTFAKEQLETNTAVLSDYFKRHFNIDLQ